MKIIHIKLQKRAFMISVAIAVLVASLLTAFPGSVKAAEMPEYTEYANMFSLDGSSERFILLDSTKDGFFVMTQSFYGKYVFDPDNTGRFDVDDPNNVAYWLNRDFIQNGNDGRKLPSIILNNIVEHEWEIELGNNQTNPATYKQKAKLAFLSTPEWEKYKSIIGYGDDKSAEYWYLRSTWPTSNVITICYSNKGQINELRNTIKYAIRPVFYLKKDFFKKVKLNTSEKFFGDNIKKMLRETYTESELRNLYSADVVKGILNFRPKPQITDLKVKGYPGVGVPMTASYTFYSEIGEKDNGSIIRWLKSDTKFGNYTVMGKGETFIPRPEDAGCYYRVEVVPISATQIGFPKATEPFPAVIQPDHKPTASEVELWGEPAVGERLVCYYSYEDKNYDREHGTEVLWERSKDGVNFTKIEAGKTDIYSLGDSTTNYILTNDDVGHIIRCRVTVKNDTSIGETVTTEPTGVVYLKPSVKDISVSLSGKTAKASYTYEGKSSEADSKKWWEMSSSPDGKFVKINVQEEELNTAGLEGNYVRFAIIAKDVDGHEGDAFYSQPIKVAGANVPFEFAGSFSQIQINKGASLYTTGAVAPKLITVDIACKYADSVTVKSDLYDVLVAKTNDGIKCTFILKDADVALGKIKIADIDTGEATLKSIKAGIYDVNGMASVNYYLPTVERW